MTRRTLPQVWFFAGPSLPGAWIRTACAGLKADVHVRPPIQQGDLLRACHGLPDVVGILDGSFHQVPAVLHKEILLALEQGIRVLGAASLGALRAAELDGFGMEGVGTVYRLYRDGVLEADDEVAVVHAPADAGYRPLTEPLVNVRHNLERARAGGVLTDRDAAALLAAARRLHYTERTYEALVRRAPRTVARAAFRTYLRANAVDLKRRDAEELVRLVVRRLRGDEPWPARKPVALHRTKYFHIFGRDYAGHVQDGVHVPDRLVLGFAKLLAPDFPGLVQCVARRCLAVDEARARGLSVAPAGDLLRCFRREKGLPGASYRDWLERQCLSEGELLAALRERDLETSLRKQYGAGKEFTADVLRAVGRRTGLSRAALVTPWMQPGIHWEEPLLRELKLRGEYASALSQAARILAYREKCFADRPDLRVAFDALAGRACEALERWAAARWGVPRRRLEPALRARGFLRYAEFLEVARAAHAYEQNATAGAE